MTDIVERLRIGRETCGVDMCRIREAKSGCTCAEAADTIEQLRAALWQCVHVVQSEIEYCKDHTTAWFKLCVATREKALAALGEKE